MSSTKGTGGLRNVRQIINIYMKRPLEACVEIHYTFYNDSDEPSEMISFPRPRNKEEEFIYLPNLEVRDASGKLLEILPQRDARCREGYICIPCEVKPHEYKTITLKYTMFPRAMLLRAQSRESFYKGWLVRYCEFPLIIPVEAGSSRYLHVSPPEKLEILVDEPEQLSEAFPQPAQPESRVTNHGCGYKIVASPPDSRGVSIRFWGDRDCVWVVRLKVRLPATIRMWLYCVLIMSFAALCGDALGLVAKILGLNLRIPYLEQLRFAAIGALIATRSWLIFEEDLTRLLSKIYTLLVVLLAIRPLLSYLLSLSFP